MKSLFQNMVTATWVEELIKRFIGDSPENTLVSENYEKDWALKKRGQNLLLASQMEHTLSILISKNMWVIFTGRLLRYFPKFTPNFLFLLRN
jgi:hypothetical protein